MTQGTTLPPEKSSRLDIGATLAMLVGIGGYAISLTLWAVPSLAEELPGMLAPGWAGVFGGAIVFTLGLTAVLFRLRIALLLALSC